MKYLALFGYVTTTFFSSYYLLRVPIIFINAGLTGLSMVESPFLNFLSYWSLYSILVYMLITFHEHDGCVLDKCPQSEHTSLISIVSTILAWSNIGNWKFNFEDMIPESLVKKDMPLKVQTQATEKEEFKMNIKNAKVRKKSNLVSTFPKLQWV